MFSQPKLFDEVRMQLTHGTAAPSEHVNKSDDQLLLGVVLPPLLLGLHMEEVNVPAHLRTGGVNGLVAIRPKPHSPPSPPRAHGNPSPSSHTPSFSAGTHPCPKLKVYIPPKLYKPPLLRGTGPGRVEGTSGSPLQPKLYFNKPSTPNCSSILTRGPTTGSMVNWSISRIILRGRRRGRWVGATFAAPGSCKRTFHHPPGPTCRQAYFYYLLVVTNFITYFI